MRVSRFWRVLLLLILLALAGLAVLTYTSVRATDCRARVLGGSGTVADPLRIQVEGDCGLTPYIDSLLPFRAIPAIELSYKGQRFNIPGLNQFFIDKPDKKAEGDKKPAQ